MDGQSDKVPLRPQSPQTAHPAEPLLDESSGAPQKSKQPSRARSDAFYKAWDRFYTYPAGPYLSRPLDTNAAGEPTHLHSHSRKGETSTVNAVTSYLEAARSCRDKVNAIVTECKRLNRKYVDLLFDLDNVNSLESLAAPPDPPVSVEVLEGIGSVKRVHEIFKDPKFIKDGATPSDVRQSALGDCWFLAGVCSLAGREDLLRNLLVHHDQDAGVYGFVFYRDGEWISVVVDDRLALKHGDEVDRFILTTRPDTNPTEAAWKDMVYVPVDKVYRESQTKGSDALYFGSCKDSNETWLPLLEKAYAKAHGDYQAIDGGFPGEAIEDLTGGVCSYLDSSSILSRDALWAQLKEVNKTYLFGAASRTNPGRNDESGLQKDANVLAGHAYTVLSAREIDGERLLKLRNPWGEFEWKGAWSDGSKEWTPDRMKALDHSFGDDGIFWISLPDFLSYYPVIDRTRIFGEDWTVSQQWTSVVVPEISAYNPTYFTLDVASGGDVVIVLCQPDKRYFTGMCGRYRYSLHFRLYEVGAEKYTYRSQSDTGSYRSCHVEADNLPAGKYQVHVKIQASRSESTFTPDEMFRLFRSTRKSKIIDAAKQFDRVAAKGNLRELEEELRQKYSREAQRFFTDNLRLKRRIELKRRVLIRLRAKRKVEARLSKIRAKMATKRAKLQAAAGRRRELNLLAGRADTGRYIVGSRTLTNEQHVAAPAGLPEFPQPSSRAYSMHQLQQQSQPQPQPFPFHLRRPARQGTADSTADSVSSLHLSEEPASVMQGEAAGPPLPTPRPAHSIASDLPLLGHAPWCCLQRDASDEDGDEGADEHVCVSDVSSVVSDDFEWDERLDGPVFTDNEDDRHVLERLSEASRDAEEEGGGGGGGGGEGGEGAGAGADLWFACCVLGLRVYARCGEVKIGVVKGGGEEVVDGRDI